MNISNILLGEILQDLLPAFGYFVIVLGIILIAVWIIQHWRARKSRKWPEKWWCLASVGIMILIVLKTIIFS